MKTLKENILKSLGFKEQKTPAEEDGFTFTWYQYKKNNSLIDVSTEYQDGDFLNQYIDFNGEKLEGREITIEDLKLLMELM